MGEPAVRVQQLAATMRLPASQLIEQLRDAGVLVRSGADRLEHAQVAAILEGVKATIDPDQARPMVVEAFAVARDSGREDWREMTHAVLKNRLLDATKRGFNEIDYGAPTFGYFVSLFPDLLTTRVTDGGSVLVLIDANAITERVALPDLATVPPRRGRIRDDLWESFADFASGDVYVWDVAEGVALVGEPSEGFVEIPTLTPVEEADWRKNFVGAIGGEVSESEGAALADWQARRLPSISLPPRLRGVWNGRLRSQMLAKIEMFFAGNSLTAPKDVLVSSDHHTSRGPRHQATFATELRTLVQRCVAIMTDEELQALSLPVHVVLRASGRR